MAKVSAALGNYEKTSEKKKTNEMRPTRRRAYRHDRCVSVRFVESTSELFLVLYVPKKELASLAPRTLENLGFVIISRS